MHGARIDIDLDRIEANTRRLVAACAAAGVAVAGVGKACCGAPAVARAMLRGGVAQLADSRLDNLERLRRGGIRAPLMLLRAPAPDEAERTVRLADLSLNSEPTTIARLAAAARAQGRRHGVVLMVDLGDLREGILPAEALRHAEAVLALDGVELLGLGANLACISGIQPTIDNLAGLADLAAELRRRLGIALPIVSGGNTFSLPLLEAGQLPAGINHLRLGASILLAAPPTPAGLHGALDPHAFTLGAPVIEDKIKPARPYGLAGEDAFGRRPSFDAVEDRPARRLILAIGREDVDPAGLAPCDARLRVVGASSDHLVVDATAAGEDYRLGAHVAFTPDYAALLAAMTSPYVDKRYLRDLPERPTLAGVALIDADDGGATAMDSPAAQLLEQGLAPALAAIGLALADPAPAGPGRSDSGPAAPLIEIAVGPESDLAAAGNPAVLPVRLGRQSGRRAHGRPGGEEEALLLFAGQADGVVAGDGWPAEHTLAVGLRDLFLPAGAATGELVLTMEDIDRHGLADCLPAAIARVRAGLRRLHLHFDLDVLAGAGLTCREAHLAMEIVHECGLPDSVSFGGVGPGAESAALVNGLLLSLLGRKVVKSRAACARLLEP
ncbi:alanine racemase [Chitinimonas koreensis]|uniref:alanine racemase n=1 Tax=Chitinimonas koreensis TaxID=356302 RepID=UPI00041A2856|nr:alanine racemase [Chitinimonas koreensis]QNM95397.1 alanine racemase [Chitinimonas koreensis]